MRLAIPSLSARFWTAVGALLLSAPPVGALTPPEPFEIAPDGTTRWTLEQAAILKPGGRQWARVMGKAFFWDQQSGSDGQACASCHFHAGADTRLRNQLNPGFNDISENAGAGDNEFGATRSDTGRPLRTLPSDSGAPTADSNVVLKPGDFPLHRLAVEADRNSPIISTTNDRVGSQGTFDMNFRKVKILGQDDKCGKPDPSIFHGGNFAGRQTTARNSPTAINAAFNFRNFWDGRANNMFNGVGVFGMRDINGDTSKRLVVLNGSTPTLGYLTLENASLASQAVGPVLSDIEASCDGRTFADVARKLYLTIPLKDQKISKSDSLLGPHVGLLGKGLKLTNLYPLMIARAFDSKYWSAPGKYKIVNGALVADPKGHTQMELNFPMFWGISIMLYEMSLVSDQSEFDTLTAAGHLLANPAFGPGGNCTVAATAPAGTVDLLLLRGCKIFSRAATAAPPPAAPADGVRGGNCFICHNSGGVTPPGAPVRTIPPMLSQGMFQNGDRFGLMIQVGKVGGGSHRHDQGVQGIGLRPFHTDLLNGANDPYGIPLSFSRQYQRYLQGTLPLGELDLAMQRAIANGVADPTNASPTNLLPLFGPPANAIGQLAPTLGVDSASKTPSLRNVALTPPYFSWGGYGNLRQAMKLYNRGLNRRDIAINPAIERAPGTACTSGDNSGTGPDGDSLRIDPVTKQLSLKKPNGDVETDCNTNTTGTIPPSLGLIDCDPNELGVVDVRCGVAPNLLDSTNDDLAALVRFMKSLTDPRVQCDAAPFDHPELTIFNGHTPIDSNKDKKADDIKFVLPAVGSAGYSTTNSYCIPNAGDLFFEGMQSRSGGAKATNLQP